MILIMSGTSDGREVIDRLMEKGYEVLATAVTEYGGELIKKKCNCNVITKPLGKEEMVELIHQNNIKILIDVTHPYAVNGSQNAMEAAKISNITYVRYERENIENSYGLYFNTYQEAEEYLYKKNGNILFTIGSNNINYFVERIPMERIFARVLPMKSVMGKCEKLGLRPRNIIGLEGPFSKTFNEFLIKEFDIKFLVTKETSKAGGFLEKIEAAKSSKIELIIIKKPDIQYTNEFNQISNLVEFIDELKNKL